VTATQIVFGGLLILILLVFAAYAGWKQWQLLQTTNADTTLEPEDRKYYRKQAGRRLIGAVLMFVMAGMLFGAFFLENRAQELATKKQEERDRGEKGDLTPEERQFGEFYATVWIMVLLDVMALISLAGADYLAIRRFGRRHYQLIQSQRKDMIRDELKRYRRERSERN
jgi:uncharacterized membrane protein